MLKILALILWMQIIWVSPALSEENGDIISLIKELGEKIGRLDTEIIHMRADMESEKQKETEYRESTKKILSSQSAEIKRLHGEVTTLKNKQLADMKAVNARFAGLGKDNSSMTPGEKHRNRLKKRANGDSFSSRKCGGNMCTRMSTGSLLPIGQHLVSPNKQVRLEMQTDGNLVIYCRGKAIWQTGTGGTPIKDGLQIQLDGNLVLYRKDGRAVWQSKTAVTDGNHLILQDDGNLVLYGMMYGHVFWQAGTGGKC